jgi:hypothetical protein
LVKELDQAAQVTALRFNKVPIIVSGAVKIRKSYYEKKSDNMFSRKAEAYIFFSENNYSIKKSKFKIRLTSRIVPLYFSTVYESFCIHVV